jgi:uncharacterized protein (DUF488 family)
LPPLWFKTGYLGHRVEDLAVIREQLNAVVVDIRFRPQSRLPMWRQAALLRVFGDDYVWCQDWGSPNFKAGPPHTMLDLDGGWETIRLIERPVILLCACRDKETCHRKPLSEWLERRHAAKVTEIDW